MTFQDALGNHGVQNFDGFDSLANAKSSFVAEQIKLESEDMTSPFGTDLDINFANIDQWICI